MSTKASTSTDRAKREIGRRQALGLMASAGLVAAASVAHPTRARAAAKPNSLRQDRDYLIPEDFGADTSASDNSAALQAALDESASTGLPLVMDNDYDIKSPLYLPSYVTWTGSGKVTNTNTSTNQLLCITVLFGNYAPAYYDRMTFFDSGAVVSNDTSVTLDSPSDASQFSAGDLVFCRSEAIIIQPSANGPRTEPHYGSFNRIVSINSSTGAIELEYPWLRDISSTKIALADNNVVDIYGTRTLYCAYKVTIDGISIASTNGFAMGYGGLLGGSIHMAEIDDMNGVYIGDVCFTDISVDRVNVDRKVIDFAGQSLGSTVTIGTATYTRTARSTTIALIALNECLHNNQISIGELQAPGYDFAGQNVIRMSQVTGHTVTIDTLSCPDLAGNVVLFVNDLHNGTGETQFVTEENCVTLTNVDAGSSLSTFVSYSNPGGQLYTCDVNGDFDGTPSSAAIQCAGSGHTIRGEYSDGDLSLGSATDMDVNVTLDNGSVVGCPSVGNNVVVVNGSPVTC